MTSGSLGSVSHAYGSMTVSPWCVRSVGTCLAIGGVGTVEDSDAGTVLMSPKSRPHGQNQNHHRLSPGGDPRTPDVRGWAPDGEKRHRIGRASTDKSGEGTCIPESVVFRGPGIPPCRDPRV